MPTDEPQSILEGYLPLAKRLARAHFVSRFDHPFLLQHVAPDDGGEAEDFRFATVEGSDADIEGLDSLLGIGPDGMMRLEVVKVVKRDSNGFEGMVNFGRTENNDIQRDHDLISKFHAYFMRDVFADFYTLIDAGSTNGTFLNGKRLLPNRKNVLSTQDVISFARTFVFRFYTPAAFHEFITILSR